MNDNFLHAALAALFLALVCVTALVYRTPDLAQERVVARRSDACRAPSSTHEQATHEAARSSCS
jgi:hypothetical protein